MSVAQPLEKIGYLSSDDDRSTVAFNQFYGVNVGPGKNITSTFKGNTAAIKPSAGGKFFGILQNNPILGEACEITRKGTSQAYAGGTFVCGDDLKTNGDGAFIKASAGDAVVATAIESAVQGDIATVYITG